MKLVQFSFLKNYKTNRDCLLKLTKIHLRRKGGEKLKYFYKRCKFYNLLNLLITYKKPFAKVKKFSRRKGRFIFAAMKSYFLEEFSILVNSLKKKIKFKKMMQFENFVNCRIYFKYTGSNIYGTITANNGDVVFVYSGGFFIGLSTRKDKTSIFVAQSLGELIAVRLYRTNAKEIFFIPFLKQNFVVRKLLLHMGYGFKLIKVFKITKVILKRRIMRNGVRLRKMPRK